MTLATIRIVAISIVMFSWTVMLFLCLMSDVANTASHSISKFNSTSTKLPYHPSSLELEGISNLMQSAIRGEYPGTDKKREGRRGPIPIWSQRTAILYYNRKEMGKPLMWLTLSLGHFGNGKNLVSNKKLLRSTWKDANPSKFSEMEKYLPGTWSDISSFETDARDDSLYVYKPVLGSGGEGISFKRGYDMSRDIRKQEEAGDHSGWVVQQFIDPYLYNGKKTHMRAITLIIVQPDGSREFFIYNKMKMFTAAEEFDEDRLMSGGDNSFMLLTNMHQSKAYFDMFPENNDRRFDSSSCIFDAETSLRDNTGSLSFESVFSSTMDMHSIIYSIIGDLVECHPTDTSIYDDACLHMMASDIAVDKDGTPYFLEMNNAMGYNAWSSEEISEFANGAASLVRDTASPYSVEESSMWYPL